MSEREEVYVCKRCGYVLPKRDAVVSGWDAEGSSTHVYCPRCGKIIAGYINRKRKKDNYFVFSPLTSTLISFMRLTPNDANFPPAHIMKNISRYHKPMAIILLNS